MKKLSTQKEVEEAVIPYLRNYFHKNTVFRKLNLTEEQLRILFEEAMTEFKQEFDVSARLIWLWSKTLTPEKISKEICGEP